MQRTGRWARERSGGDVPTRYTLRTSVNYMNHLGEIMGSHAINIINGEMYHTCPKCELERPRSEFYLTNKINQKNGLQVRHVPCKECTKEKNSTKESKEHRVEYNLIKNFGITKQKYDEMLEAQGGTCFLCNNLNGGRSLSLDHCHDTGKVRGLLCHTCNVGLGHFMEDIPLLRRAIEYLERANGLEENKVIG